MSTISARAVYWTPRILSILFIAFLSIFALDVFEEHLGFWPTLLALLLHLIPSLVLTMALLLAWRWEWIGAAVYGIAGFLYIAWVVSMSRPVSPSMRFLWVLMIAGPAFFIASFFLANWLKRKQLRASMGRSC
ncbi:MAG: hypothetical protein NTW74_04550 [Acidobacteria bacterium]|nr:hypothetical protein [Acidobacteriota bacterium]